MITVELSRDWKDADKVMHDPDVWDRCASDEQMSQPLTLRQALAHRHNAALVVRKDGERVGYFLALRTARREFEVHVMFLRSCRGADALAAGKAAVRWCFENTNTEALTSYCPDCIPESLVFARWCGFKCIGLAPFKRSKNGKEHDVRLVRITRKDWLCQ